MGFYKGKEPMRKTIGVFGSERGTGVTHLCIALSNFISLESGKEVKLLDVSGTGELSRVRTARDGKLFGVSYLPDMGKEQIPRLMNESYDYMILDFGNDRKKNYAEFLRCSKKIVLGSFCPWKRQAYDEFMQFVKNEKSYEDWDFCELFGRKKDKKEFKRLYGLPLRTVPFILDPYELGKEEFIFLKEFIRGL